MAKNFEVCARSLIETLSVPQSLIDDFFLVYQSTGHNKILQILLVMSYHS